MTAFTFNGDEVSLQRALAWSAIEDDEPFLQMTAERAALIQVSIQAGIEISAEELQAAVDDFRIQAGLDSADETRRWLKANRMDESGLADACRLRVIRDKLLSAIDDAEVAAVYHDHAEEFETATLYSMTLATRKEAEKMADRLRDGAVNFHLAAMEHSIDEQTRPGGGYLGDLSRADLPEIIAVSVFSVDPGDIVGPLKTGPAYEIFLVERFHKLALEEVEPVIRLEILSEQMEALLRRSVVLLPE